jgi:LRR receptor-like serine/threonine-protein kinase FLS2
LSIIHSGIGPGALQCSAEQPEERIDIEDALTTLKKIKAKFLKDSRGIETSYI